jgi:hypothetical protein
VLVLVMIPDSGWLTSCAIEAVNALRVVTRATWASSERAPAEGVLCDHALCHVLKGADDHRG